MSEQEKLPSDESIQVIDYVTIYKTKGWWKAVVLANHFGHNKIMIFLWQWTEIKRKDASGKLISTGQYRWKRKQKMGINFASEWSKLSGAIEGYLPKIDQGR